VVGIKIALLCSDVLIPRTHHYVAWQKEVGRYGSSEGHGEEEIIVDFHGGSKLSRKVKKYSQL
jgi:hypothetical protein